MNWKKVKLGDIVTITSGGTPLTSKREYYDNGTIPWVKTGDLKVKHLSEVPDKITQLGLENSSAKIFPINTVLVAMYGATIGACSILNVEAATNQACAALLPSEKINPNYLFFYLSSIKPELIKKGIGGGQPNISGTILKNTEVRVPPLADQKHIAAVLDKADALRQQNLQLLAHYDELLQSTFIELFGDPVKNPKGWEVKKLEDILDFMTSGSRGWAEYYSNSGSLFLRIQNVGYNKLKMNEIAFVNPPNTAEAKRTKVCENDILLSITADLGRTAVIPKNFGDAYISQHLALLRPKSGMNSLFISELLASDFGQRQFKSANKGGVKAGLNFNDIKSTKILLPPLPLQQHFAKIVEQIETQKEAVRQSLTESEGLFEGLLAEYFGAA